MRANGDWRKGVVAQQPVKNLTLLSLFKPCFGMEVFHCHQKDFHPLLDLRLKFALPLILVIAPLAAVQAIPMQDVVPPRHWECVPIARSISGIQIYGDAYTWWGQAEGRYKRGDAPKKGAVLAFQPHGAMRLGHVAAVSKIIDDRTILVTHSNWSPINGTRGQIERDVKVIDVSDENDWSKVRVWFAPSQGLGTTAWPIYGFIYPTGKAPMTLPGGLPAAATTRPRLDYAPFAIGTQADPNHADNVPKPTGRLAYLGKMLPRLK